MRNVLACEGFEGDGIPILRPAVTGQSVGEAEESVPRLGEGGGQEASPFEAGCVRRDAGRRGRAVELSVLLCRGAHEIMKERSRFSFGWYSSFPRFRYWKLY